MKSLGAGLNGEESVTTAMGYIKGWGSNQSLLEARRMIRIIYQCNKCQKEITEDEGMNNILGTNRSLCYCDRHYKEAKDLLNQWLKS